MQRNKDILIIVCTNLILLALLFLSNIGWSDYVLILRVPLGMFYMFFVPGYALQAALFPLQSHLARLDRFAISIGLCIALMPILGLVLDGPLGGIFVWQSIIFLSSVTALFSFVAVYRRSASKETSPTAFEEPSAWSPWWKNTGRGNRLIFVMFVAVVCLAAVVAVLNFSTPKSDQFFTELSITGPGGVAADYPQNVRVDQPFPLSIGVTNHEGHDFTYSIQAQMAGRTLASTAPFTLADGQSIALNVELSAATPGDQQLLEILLLSDKQIYRRLYLWINVKQP